MVAVVVASTDRGTLKKRRVRVVNSYMYIKRLLRVCVVSRGARIEPLACFM